MVQFADRLDAGRQLAARLEQYRGRDAVILGMARGGVVVGYAVAEALDLELLALIVRKIGAPQNPELAIGAVSVTGAHWLDNYIVSATGADQQYIDRETAAQVAEAQRRQREYGAGATLSRVRGRTAIVTDDGIATGASAVVAAQSARDLGASSVVLAVPVASPQAIMFLEGHADRIVVLDTPDPFYAVGMYYHDFAQVSDQEVIEYVEANHQRRHSRNEIASGH